MAEPQSYIDYLRALLSETQQLQEVAAHEDWEQLVTHLDTRQALIDRIDALPAAPLAEAEVSVAAALLREIMRLDEAIAPKVLATLENTRASIEDSRLTRKTINAYRKATHTPTETGPSRFLDKQR